MTLREFWQPYYVFSISGGSILRWFWDINLVVNELSTKSTHWDNVLASNNQVYGPWKELRELRSRKTLTSTLFFPSTANAPIKRCIWILTAKQVTMCCDLSCCRVFHCFLTPSFVFSGASAKSRCLGKLSHPSSLSRQVKTLIFICKITITKTSLILHFARMPMRIYNIPYCPKRAKLLPFGMSQPIVSISVASVNPKLSFGPAVQI